VGSDPRGGGVEGGREDGILIPRPSKRVGASLAFIRAGIDCCTEEQLGARAAACAAQPQARPQESGGFAAAPVRARRRLGAGDGANRQPRGGF
jgi:hypothetical protein